MTRPRLLLLFSLGLAQAVAAQPTFDYGDVIVTGYRYSAYPDIVSTIRIYARDGEFKRELVSGYRLFTEPFVRDGVVFVGARSPDAIERIDPAGRFLAPFTTRVVNMKFLSPGPRGGLLATNNSGEIYQFDSAGNRIRFRDFTAFPSAYGGIDLGHDECTVFFATEGSLVRWDACRDTPATFFGENLQGSSHAFRLLPDGTFLVAFLNRVVHRDRAGHLIREYPIPAWAVALDTDGTSFWADANGCLLRIDIATGEILSDRCTGFIIMGISVVGEPRAGLAGTTSIPTTSTVVLLILGCSLVAVAMLKLRLA